MLNPHKLRNWFLKKNNEITCEFLFQPTLIQCQVFICLYLIQWSVMCRWKCNSKISKTKSFSCHSHFQRIRTSSLNQSYLRIACDFTLIKLEHKEGVATECERKKREVIAFNLRNSASVVHLFYRNCFCSQQKMEQILL